MSNLTVKNLQDSALIQTNDLTTILADYIPVFLKDIDIGDNSKSTYTRALRQLFVFLQSNNIKQATVDDIKAYKRYLIEQKLSDYTISNYLVVTRRFFAWAEEKMVCPNIAKTIKGMKTPRGFRKDPLTIEQVKEIINNIDRSALQGKRDYAIINLLLRTGLRGIELQRANIGDINQSGGEAKLYIQGKGRSSKDDFVLVPHGALKPLLEYIETRGKTRDTDPLFASLSDQNRGERMTTRSLRRIVKNAFLSSSINNRRLTAHSLRHTAITTALIAGSSLQEVQAMARHSNINTTLIYSHNINRVINSSERKIDEYLSKQFSIAS